jgi:hypothetical protein
MDGNVEFLNYIHQNAEMGKDTIHQLIGISQNKEYQKNAPISTAVKWNS